MQRSPTCEHCQRNYELRDCKPIGPRIPLLLSCGHTFCEGCLTKSARLYDAIECFVCKKKQALQPKGEKGVGNLLPNIYMLGLLLYNRHAASHCATENVSGSAISSFSGLVNFGKSIVSKESGSNKEETNNPTKVLCDECSVKPAACRCKQCEDTKFCDGCYVKIHRVSKTLNKHTPLPLDYLSPEQLTCSRHEGRKLEFYDKELKEPVCGYCAISKTCKGHEIVPISELKEESQEEMIAAVNNAEETLSWLEHSKEVLSASLSEEVMDTNQLFSEIHATFTTLHTHLLNRQTNIMREASEIISNSKGAHSQMQELSLKIREIKKALKDYEMIKGDKQFNKMKGKEILHSLQSLASQPSILQPVDNDDSLFNFVVNDKDISTLNGIGEVVRSENNRFQWLNPSDVDEETKEKIKCQVQKSSIEIVQCNELLTEQLSQKKTIRSMGMPQGHYELVYLTHVKDPLDFMIQRCSDKDRLQVMMTAINKYCRHSSVADYVYNVEEGQILCAQFTADNNWYRACVVNAFSPERPDVVPSHNNGLPVEVFYIDYGNTEWVPLNRLKKIQDGFLEVAAMAVPCSLMDIVPPFKAVTWPERSIKVFNSLTGDRPMLMNIRKRVSGKLFVDLKRPDDDEPTHDDDRPVSVRDAMVFLDVAVFFSPSSFPNADIHRSIRDYPPHEPFEENAFVDVTVTHIENPHSIYVQRLDSNILNEQAHLSKLYFGKNKRAWRIDWPYRNLVCAAKFTGDKTWYRAVVRHVNHDETVLVEYVDYGNSETLPFKDIKKIPEMYLKMSKQSVKVSLYNLEKPDGCDEWPAETCGRLEEELLNRSFVCLNKEINDKGIPNVVLFDTSTDEDVNMNDVLALKSIAKPIKPVQSKLSEAKLPASTITTQQSGMEVYPHDNVETSSVASKSNASMKSFSSNTSSQSSKHTPHYPPARMPPVSTFTATGVFVDDDALVYLHVMMDDSASLEAIMQQINTNVASYGPHPTNTSDLRINQACLGKYAQDGFLYRVSIQQILNDQEVKIHFIDFGNTEVVNVSELLTEPRYLIVPAQCIHVEVANVEPTGNGWNSEAIALMKEMIQEKTIVVKLKGTEKADIYVDDNQSMGEVLISRGWARSIQDSDNQPRLQQPTTNEPSEAHGSGFLSPISFKQYTDFSSPVPSTQSSVRTSSFNTQESPARSQGMSTLPSSPSSLQSSTRHKEEEEEDAVLQSSDYFWFRGQELPDVGVCFDVTVTQVDQPDIVYIQRYPPSLDDPLFADDAYDATAENAYVELKELEDISGLINCADFFEDKKLNVKPSVGMACIANYSEDELYYRARVDEVNEEEGVASVVFVDYGTKETVPMESIKPITVNLAQLPTQSTRVKIAGVNPLPKKPEDKQQDLVRGTEWTVDVMKQFYAMVANKRLIAQVVDVTQVIPVIHLYDRCIQEDSATGETTDVLLGQLMESYGLAKFTPSEVELTISNMKMNAKATP